MNKSWSAERCIFIISAYAPADYYPLANLGVSYHKLNNLNKARSTDIVVIIGDLNTYIKYLGTEKSLSSGRRELNGTKLDNSGCFLQLCGDDVFLTSTNFRTAITDVLSGILIPKLELGFSLITLRSIITDMEVYNIATSFKLPAWTHRTSI